MIPRILLDICSQYVLLRILYMSSGIWFRPSLRTQPRWPYGRPAEENQINQGVARRSRILGSTLLSEKYQIGQGEHTSREKRRNLLNELEVSFLQNNY